MCAITGHLPGPWPPLLIPLKTWGGGGGGLSVCFFRTQKNGFIVESLQCPAKRSEKAERVSCKVGPWGPGHRVLWPVGAKKSRGCV